MTSDEKNAVIPLARPIAWRCAPAALLVLSVASPSLAAIKAWNAGPGTWGTAANWSPAGIPGTNDTVLIGNLPGVQNSIVTGTGATAIPASIEVSDGMTFDTAGVEFVGANLLVALSGGDSRMIVRPHAGINQYDFIGEVNIGAGSTLELTNNVPIRLYWDSYSWGRIEGWGTVQVNSATPFNNNGVINPGNNGLHFEQGWTTELRPFDLDGSAENGQVWLDIPFSVFELEASGLADPFDGVISMVSGALLTMNVEDGWVLNSGGVLNASKVGVSNAAAQVNGADLTLAGSVTVGEDGSLRFLSDTTIESTAANWLLADSRLEYDGATIVNGGYFHAFSNATLDFDGQTTIHGGGFHTPTTDPSDGVVNFNGSTTWNGTNGPIEVQGIARQIGNAFVSGPTVINGDVLDMDGDGDTLWTIWNDLTINADLAAAPDAEDTFTGTLNIASTAGKLTVNVQPADWDFHMSGEMNLIGHPSVYHTRYAGDTLRLHGNLNASGKVASEGYIWAYEGAINIADPDATLRLDDGCIVGLDCAISGDGEMRVGPGAPLKALFPSANFGGVGLVNDGRMGIPGYADVDRFQQTANGVWGVYLRGYDAEDNDQLRVTGGDAKLDGELEIKFFLFAPVVGDEFTILTATGNVIGRFDANPTNCADGRTYHWTVLYGSHDVRLRLVAITNLRGDMNCDCAVNNFDIDPFILAISDPAAYAVAQPDCDINNADVNNDGLLNNFDIDPFVECLGAGCP